MLLACSVNQGIRSSSMATVTILPGVINQGEESMHHPATHAAIPHASPFTPATVQGPARAPPATFRLPSLALCHNSNAERVALEGGGSPWGWGGQKDAGAAGHWGCYTALLGKKYTLHRGAAMGNGEEAERMELPPALWQLSHRLHNKDPSPRF